MFKPSVLVLAVLLSSTALWSAFVDGSLDVTTALIRFLIAVPVAAVMVFAFNLVLRSNADRPARQAAQPPAEPADTGLEAG
ncbi:MAG TPA: hypothetical protein VFU36_13595 [Jatrophihabitans sp.]|nr:hypothetical protein [Jatrophihabitans sp.]